MVYLRIGLKGGHFMTNALQRDGLSIDLLCKLSYRSSLGISLKKNLHYFSIENCKCKLDTRMNKFCSA